MIVAISSLITLIGLWCVLRKYFTAGTTIATLLLMALGTNLFLMSVYSGAIQASILLALMVLVVWMTQRWYEKPGWIETIVAGLAMGSLIFIKPAGFSSILLFIFWGAYNKETFNQKWKIFKDQLWQLILIIVLFGAGLVIRLISPQAFEGSWFCDYVQHKRAVYLVAPWLWMVLFSIKNGWLIYTPLILFAIPGFYILAERNKKIFYSTFLFSLGFILLLASTPDMTAPDNFSQARMTEIFAVLFIPIGYFVSWVFEGRWLRKTTFCLILAAFAGLNLFQTWQYRNKILNPWFTTPEYYKAVFLKTHVNEKTRILQEFYNLDMSSYLANESEFNISTLVFIGFEDDPGSYGGHIQGKIVAIGRGAMKLDSNLRFTPDLNLQISKLPADYPLGIRLSASVYSETGFRDNPANLIITLLHKGQFYRYKTISLQELNLDKGKWNSVKLDYVIPRLYDPADLIICNLWYTGNSAMYVDNLKIELFEQK
ncbi:MAG: hypothetical protein NTY96_09485 [Bacteroidetes bacterium]|nr:hypothetical protein [Bacteroidota bacterium]